jgi:hypothetical protein
MKQDSKSGDSWAHWCIPVILALQRLRAEDNEFKTIWTAFKKISKK